MGSSLPKQYLQIGGATVLEHSLRCFLSHSKIAGIAIAVNTSDASWRQVYSQRFTELEQDKILISPGGDERCHSVVNALDELANHAEGQDWVMVHDAARPCLSRADIDRLIIAGTHSEGAVLGVPVRDTMKRAEDNGMIIDTVERSGLWHALTPQMFRLEVLYHALTQALYDGAVVTDESSAMEMAGHPVAMVAGSPGNIKITHPEDLALAEHYLNLNKEED